MPEDCRTLSPRHVQILELVADDLTNEEIAARLGVTTQTVKNHLREACIRLGVRGRAGAVGRAYRLGILPLSSPDEPSRQLPAAGTATIGLKRQRYCSSA